jgi:hypothetical protein
MGSPFLEQTTVSFQLGERQMYASLLVRRTTAFVAFLLFASTVLVECAMPILIADDTEQKEAKERKDRYTNWMRTYAEETKITLVSKIGNEEAIAELFPNPVFRYSDEERSIPDATLWIWTQNSRPVALQKVEGNNIEGGQRWTICFASLSEGLVNTKWPSGVQYSSREPGIKFGAIPNAEAPANRSRSRLLQMKTLKDRFTARLSVTDDGKGGAETRTIPKPVFEYKDPETKLPIGAIFGMSATGTNPDLLLLIEAREANGKLRWEYARARMTANSVRMRLDDAEIWSVKHAVDGAFDNWTYYFLPRSF